MSKYLELPKDIFRGLTQDRDAGEKRVTTVGTRASGKSTVLGLVTLTCETLSAYDPNFTFTINEKSTGIRTRSSNLRQGRFPPATPTNEIYEADLIVRFKDKGKFNPWKTVRVPFAESAGEDCAQIMGKFGEGEYHLHPRWAVNKELTGKILSSNGLIQICPISRALLWHRMPDEWDKEPEDLPPDPDVNVVRMLKEIFAFKENNRSHPIEGIAMLLTKYDLIQEYVQNMGLDLISQPENTHKFMQMFFPQTSAELKHRGLDKVKFFPSFVQVERTTDGRVIQWSNGGDKIQMHPQRPRTPIYSEQAYIELLTWLRETFTK